MHNTSTTQSPSHPKIEGLNALRFFAFFWVFCIHALPAATSTDGSFYQAISNLVSYGGVGVDIFFVLSSFLLTYLALREKQSTGRFSVKNFLVRRALRIFPLYFLILTFCFTVFPFLSRLTNNDISLPKNPLYLFLFLSNYDKSEYIFALKLLWTVSIEEQYYFTWALALFLSGKRIVTEALLQNAPLPFVKLMGHGTMSIEYYAPVGEDKQAPHMQDEIYVVIRGTGMFNRNSEMIAFGPGDVLFVPAGMEHRFENFTDDFATWVIFYGVDGGEALQATTS